MKLTLIQILVVLALLIGLSSQTAQKTNTEGVATLSKDCCLTTNAPTLTLEQREAEMDRKLAKIDSVTTKRAPSVKSKLKDEKKRVDKR